MLHTKHEAMSWNWTRLDEDANGQGVVRQIHEYGCGAACAEMLLADRGIAVDQLLVATKLHPPCTAHELARRLNELSGPARRWLGGQLDHEPPLARALLAELGRFGTWAAQLIPEGGP